MPTITCCDCGAQRNAQRKSTRYCRGCRILRDAEHYASSRKKCSAAKCDVRFTPIQANDPWCGKHNPGLSHARGECRLCKKPDSFFFQQGVAVCNDCARDADQRIVFIAALRRRQQERREANGWTPAAVEVEELV